VTRVRLVLHQFSFDYKTYIREPTALFFTAVMPLMFLVLFVGVFGNADIPVGHNRFVHGATYYVPSILALAIISATAVNLAISLAGARERGTLKRLRATPLPPSTYLIARVLTQIITVTIIAAIVIAFGRFAYNVSVPASSWPPLLLTLAIGIMSFCSVGFLMTLMIRSEQAAPAVTNAVILPLQFMSGVFFPRGTIPLWMRDIAGIFPIKHLVDAVFTVFDPTNHGSRLAGTDLAVLALWGIGSLIVAARFFRWTPTNR
jgi:ABC-2 type transport system permease protein